jgi:hypothetical protein
MMFMIAAPVDCTSQTPEELLESLVEDQRMVDLQQLFMARKAAAIAQSMTYQDLGYASPIEWIRRETQITSTAAADRICVGEQMDALAQSVEAVMLGEIGFAHLVVIARTAEALRDSPTAKPFDEEKLLAQARVETSLTTFRDYCLNYRHAKDPEGYAEGEAEAAQERFLEIGSPGGGMVSVRGLLDPAGAAALRTALEPLARKDGADDDRCRKRRLADALIELTHHALDSGELPQRNHQRPHLNFTTTLETLLGLAGSPAANLEFSDPASSKMVERHACDGSLTRILLDSQGAVIEVGRAKRVISPPQYKALVARDQHCVWPGCDRPPSWTSGHHLVHWIHKGETDLPNLVLLCYRHHWMVHEGGWQIARTDEGRILTVPPAKRYEPWTRGPD